MSFSRLLIQQVLIKSDEPTETYCLKAQAVLTVQLNSLGLYAKSS